MTQKQEGEDGVLIPPLAEKAENSFLVETSGFLGRTSRTSFPFFLLAPALSPPSFLFLFSLNAPMPSAFPSTALRYTFTPFFCNCQAPMRRPGIRGGPSARAGKTDVQGEPGRQVPALAPYLVPPPASLFPSFTCSTPLSLPLSPLLPFLPLFRTLPSPSSYPPHPFLPSPAKPISIHFCPHTSTHLFFQSLSRSLLVLSLDPSRPSSPPPTPSHLLSPPFFPRSLLLPFLFRFTFLLTFH